VPRFGKDKDVARREELDREAAEEVERLTRRGGPPGMGGGPGMGGPRIGMPSPLEQIAEEVRDAPRPSMRRQAPPRKVAPKPQQAFTPMPSGSVGSSFGPGGLNPGPRTGVTVPPPPAFGGGAYEEDLGGDVVGPPVYSAEPDEDEEMSITEIALMDYAARTGHNPEDLVMQYDASSAEEMRDVAMRKFYDRQKSRGPGVASNNPFAPAGMRRGPGGPVAAARNDDPAAAGGALAQRLANRRRREEEEARRARGDEPAAPATAGAAPGRAKQAPPAEAEGALAKVLARRRQSLGIDEPAAPGPRHAQQREEASPGMRVVPVQPVVNDNAPPPEDLAASAPTRRSAKKSPATATPAKATKAPAKRAKKAGASLASPPATKKAPAPAAEKAPATKKTPTAKKAAAKAKKAGTGAKAVFCIECGEKNPAIAKFCFNCGTRLAAPEG
jgi:hypothetical protein